MIPIDFNWIISTITDVVSPGALIKDKFQRHEIVIKLLKKFNLYPALPAAEVLTENKFWTFALSQQMRGWFETLGYRFEKYEIWEND